MLESSNLLAGNHALCCVGNLPRTSGAKRTGHFKSTADLEHRDDVIHPYALGQPARGRSDIDRALGVVNRIWLVGAAQSQLSRELQRIFSLSDFM